MSIAKITMTGQETYLSRTNRSLFDFMSIPSGIDKDNLIDNIMMECGEFEVLYSDPEFNRSAIGTWSTKHYRTFEKWITALNIEYNPLENYDRFEDWKDNGTENTTSNTSDTSHTSDSSNTSDRNNTTSSSKTDVNGSSDNKGTTEDKVSAFDSSSYQESELHETNSDERHQDTTKTDGNINNTGSSNTSGTSDSNGTSNTTGNKTDSSTHIGRIHGNIGVTTSQQMLQSELDIAKFNIINEITKIFMQELCICIYE